MAPKGHPKQPQYYSKTLPKNDQLKTSKINTNFHGFRAPDDSKKEPQNPPKNDLGRTVGPHRSQKTQKDIQTLRGHPKRRSRATLGHQFHHFGNCICPYRSQPPKCFRIIYIDNSPTRSLPRNEEVTKKLFPQMGHF